MNLTTFSYLFAGILLNACAQLLLKAGTLRLGEVSLAPSTLISTLGHLATNLPIIAGLCLYGLSVIPGLQVYLESMYPLHIPSYL